MSSIGTNEYVIGVIHDKEIWYYVGEKDADGRELKPDEKHSSFLVDAKRYDDEESIADDLPLIAESLTRKILEIQRCPKCGKEFTDYPALSREDNVTEICPECGVREAIEAYQKATQ